MGFSNPSVQNFKDNFVRDFPYGTDPNVSVLDSDITYAFLMTNVNINQALFADQGSYTLGYNLMSAHYLVMNLRASSQGINGQYNFLQASKSAGSVNEAFAIPPRIMENPYWAMMTKTNYGQQFLFLILPQLEGQIFNAYGTTQAAIAFLFFSSYLACSQALHLLKPDLVLFGLGGYI